MANKTNTQAVQEMSQLCAEQIANLEDIEHFYAEKTMEFTKKRMEIHATIAVLKLKAGEHQVEPSALT